MRRVLGAMHLAMLLPPGVKNLTLVLPYFLEQFKGPHGISVGGNGIYVPASDGFPEARWVHNEILFCSNDTRAGPYVSRIHQAPSLRGAGTHEWIDGFSVGNTTCYLQAVRYLAMPPGMPCATNTRFHSRWPLVACSAWPGRALPPAKPTRT
jgi:hypothetical protein